MSAYYDDSSSDELSSDLDSTLVCSEEDITINAGRAGVVLHELLGILDRRITPIITYTPTTYIPIDQEYLPLVDTWNNLSADPYNDKHLELFCDDAGSYTLQIVGENGPYMVLVNTYPAEALLIMYHTSSIHDMLGGIIYPVGGYSF